MIFVANEEVEETGGAYTHEATLKVNRGYILRYDIRMSSGTDATSYLKIFYHGHQILPANADQGLLVTNIFIRMPELLPILEPPYELLLKLSNSHDDAHNYVNVAVLLIEPALMNMIGARFAEPLTPIL